MTNALTADGLTINTLQEEITLLNTGLQGIYGADINIDSNSPDGQLINIFAQAVEDQLELIQQVYNSFDPDRAVGRPLDERCAINNVARAGGTFTTIAITIVVDRTVTLQGLDADFNNINGVGYTVQDNAGTKFILIDTVTLTAGTYSKNFRAQQVGLVETTVDTITIPVTIVPGVISVNNPSAPLEVGQNQETDSQLRVRRQRSVSINSAGYLNGLIGACLALNGVTEVRAYENTTNITDADGIPAHGIWLIMEGGANTAIANVLLNKKSMGAPMKGAVEVGIDLVNGDVFTAKFDRPTAINLWISLEIQPTGSVIAFNEVAIRQYIVEHLSYGIGDFASTSEVTPIIQLAITSTGGVGVPVNVQISDDGITYTDYLPAPAKDDQWTLATTRIIINIIS